MPSRTFLEVVYTDGLLTLSSDFYEGEFSLHFEDTETGESHVVSSIYVNEIMPLLLNNGRYDVTATNIDGITLIGSLEIY